MKLGQMASYLDEGLPEPLRLALGTLQSNAPPMSFELAKGVIEGELGSLPAHVEGVLIGALARDLAVGAGVLAAQGCDEDVEGGEFAEAAVTGASLDREQFDRQVVACLADYVLRPQLADQWRVGGKFALGQLPELGAIEQ